MEHNAVASIEEHDAELQKAIDQPLTKEYAVSRFELFEQLRDQCRS
jgi:hypothetical protein